MKIFLTKAIFVNRAPFNRLELDFTENEIGVLSGINGKGKTTILSHIVDAFYEMARPHFQDFEDKQNKYYRLSSPLYNLNSANPSFVYFRFRLPEKHIDYVDIRGVCTEDQYNAAIPWADKLPFASFSSQLQESNNIKWISQEVDKKTISTIFSSNIMTYFPSYRYETPSYLTDPYKVKFDFKKQSGFSNYLKNPIENVSGLNAIANWIMDVVLDLQYGAAVSILKGSIDLIMTLALSSKNVGAVRFGVGQRGFGGTRLQLVKVEGNKNLYPTIFNLSSGELALLCLFGEVLRQADNLRNNITLNEITGIVLIDEVDKHLHIKLQKEVLPVLFSIFPSVQFIVSSHSPFLNLGLSQLLQSRTKILDIESGLAIQPINDPQYQEVYEMMVTENERYKNLYISIESQLEKSKHLQIITEGKNTEHIRKAIELLKPELLEKVKIVSGAEDKTGQQQLKNAFEIMSRGNHIGKFLFVWDCDSLGLVTSIQETPTFYKFCFDKTSNSKIKKGIENLYPEHLFIDEFYDVREEEIDYGGFKTEKKFNKGKFASKVMVSEDKEHFHNFEPLIRKIELLLDN